jgi:hypothetical protein
VWVRPVPKVVDYPRLLKTTLPMHTAIRRDTSIYLVKSGRNYPTPDSTLYLIDVAAGEEIPGKAAMRTIALDRSGAELEGGWQEGWTSDLPRCCMSLPITRLKCGHRSLAGFMTEGISAVRGRPRTADAAAIVSDVAIHPRPCVPRPQRATDLRPQPLDSLLVPRIP